MTNLYVVGLFDCYSKEVPVLPQVSQIPLTISSLSKNTAETNEELDHQLAVQYSKVSVQAVIMNGVQELTAKPSMATLTFLTAMASNTKTFPKCLTSLDAFSNMDVIIKTNLQVILSYKTKTTIVKEILNTQKAKERTFILKQIHTAENPIDLFQPLKLLSSNSNEVKLLCNMKSSSSNLQVALRILVENPKTKKPSIRNQIQELLPTNVNILQVIHLMCELPSKPIWDICPKYFQDVLSDPNQNCLIAITEPQTSFKEFISSKNFSPKSLIWHCSEIAFALLTLWEHGIVHRDMGLANIQLSPEGFPVITDFSCAGFVVDKETGKIERTTVLGGNEAHMAPEILNSEIGKPIYYLKQPSFELGIICFEIISPNHSPPFKGYPLAIRDGKPPRITVPVFKKENFPFLLEFPVEFQNLLGRMLENNPQQRMGIKEACTSLQDLI